MCYIVEMMDVPFATNAINNATIKFLEIDANLRNDYEQMKYGFIIQTVGLEVTNTNYSHGVYTYILSRIITSLYSQLLDAALLVHSNRHTTDILEWSSQPAILPFAGHKDQRWG